MLTRAPKRHEVEITLHGDVRVDPYGWMRDKDGDPDVIPWLESENARTSAWLAPHEALKKALYDEMLGRIQEDDEDAPAPKGRFEYYNRTVAGLPYPVFCRRPRGGGAEEVLLDENLLAEGHEFQRVGGRVVSPDGRRMAVLVDHSGAEKFKLFVRDLESGVDTALIDDAAESLAWGDDQTLFYCTLDSAMRPEKAWRIRAEAGASPELVHAEPDERLFVSVSRTRSGRWVDLRLGSHAMTEHRVIPTSSPSSAPRLVLPRAENVEYELSCGGDRFFMTTNEGAETFKVVELSFDGIVLREVVPVDPSVTVEEVVAFRTHVAVLKRIKGLHALVIIDRDDRSERVVSFSDPAYALGIGTNLEFEADRIRVDYESPIAPSREIDVSFGDLSQTIIKIQPVKGGFDESRYVVERIWAKSKDGTAVPISLARRRDVAVDGKAPGFLRGYGAYGLSSDPLFSITAISLLDRGLVVATAHVRGGSDLGRRWYLDGKLAKKQNSFDDFEACARELQRSGHVAPGRLAAWGGSAGGLLMGAVVNQAPDAFGAVVAEVPFVDVVNTMLDPTLPLTVIEYEEWGNPNIAADYFVIKAYAPYENVKAQGYPPILATGGLNDPRVGFWEPAKWAAKLRDLKTDPHEVLLHIHMGAGHGGRSGRYGWLDDRALMYTFVLVHVGTGVHS